MSADDTVRLQYGARSLLGADVENVSCQQLEEIMRQSMGSGRYGQILKELVRLLHYTAGLSNEQRCLCVRAILGFLYHDANVADRRDILRAWARRRRTSDRLSDEELLRQVQNAARLALHHAHNEIQQLVPKHLVKEWLRDDPSMHVVKQSLVGREPASDVMDDCITATEDCNDSAWAVVQWDEADRSSDESADVNTNVGILALPEELLEMVKAHLTYVDFQQLRRTCRLAHRDLKRHFSKMLQVLFTTKGMNDVLQSTRLRTGGDADEITTIVLLLDNFGSVQDYRLKLRHFSEMPMEVCYLRAMEQHGMQMLQDLIRKLPNCRDVRIICRRFRDHFPATAMSRSEADENTGERLSYIAFRAIGASKRPLSKLHIDGVSMGALKRSGRLLRRLTCVTDYRYTEPVQPNGSVADTLVSPGGKGLQSLWFDGRTPYSLRSVTSDYGNLQGITRLSLSNAFTQSPPVFRRLLAAMPALESLRMDSFQCRGPEGFDPIFRSLCEHAKLAYLDLCGVWTTKRSKLSFTVDNLRFAAPRSLQAAILAKDLDCLPPASDFERPLSETPSPDETTILYVPSDWVEDFVIEKW